MITEIKLTDSIKIAYGNMAFILEASGFETLYKRCVNLEQSLKYDYNLCAHNFRYVIEEFVICEESKRRNPDIVSDKQAFEKVRNEINKIKKNDNYYTVETFCSLFVNSPNIELIKNVVMKYMGKAEYKNDVILTGDLREIGIALSNDGFTCGIIINTSTNCITAELNSPKAAIKAV